MNGTLNSLQLVLSLILGLGSGRNVGVDGLPSSGNKSSESSRLMESGVLLKCDDLCSILGAGLKD